MPFRPTDEPESLGRAAILVRHSHQSTVAVPSVRDWRPESEETGQEDGEPLRLKFEYLYLLR